MAKHTGNHAPATLKLLREVGALQDQRSELDAVIKQKRETLKKALKGKPAKSGGYCAAFQQQLHYQWSIEELTKILKRSEIDALAPRTPNKSKLRRLVDGDEEQSRRLQPAFTVAKLAPLTIYKLDG